MHINCPGKKASRTKASLHKNTVDKNPVEMVENLFPRKLDALNLRLAFQETMAHLIYLENKGKIKQETKNNSIYWKII